MEKSKSNVVQTVFVSPRLGGNVLRSGESQVYMLNDKLFKSLKVYNFFFIGMFTFEHISGGSADIVVR